jgi:AraC-like DNA-binding protein
MHSDIAKRWRIQDLAAHACLSPSQFARVFRDSFRVTPLGHLTILRV